ncbi:YhcN/YlaJ family sporulation lipoprotein [Cytobacillus spongiae]|jgi:YhcN/YlaJ family sporulation lipoprotein|uniref:YhcN/YlaJ family sporulation lipoprotein n=1 Tax=Cytobacillus spongiae TaxID=2901381 RepID=UPI001F37D6B9|nr:YhcN/YlaJ family sporulation lipoprotein [Cytobacillus spongiae]UII57268.1 YhcN/YlaJ family sporulation lipoprotein [Cytobacillus spongiae]
MKKWIPFLLAIVTITGCNGNEQGTDENKQNLINVKNTAIESVDRQSGQEISKHLVDLATSIPSVRDATAVVLGRYAIVGIDVDKDIERSQVGSIKYSVAESLKNDPHGARAIVVADPDINARLKELTADIQNGEPVQGIVNELADISGRLMPEVPADIIDPKPKNGINDSKDKLENKEKQNLEKQQEKQSNYYKD